MEGEVERRWLEGKIEYLRQGISLTVGLYDDGHISKATLEGDITTRCTNMLQDVYTHAFTEGIRSAEIDDDPYDDEQYELDDDDHKE